MILVSRKNPPCPACNEAKAILNRKNVEYNEYDITKEGVRDALMAAGVRTIPALFDTKLEPEEYLGSLDYVKTLQ